MEVAATWELANSKDDDDQENKWESWIWINPHGFDEENVTEEAIYIYISENKQQLVEIFGAYVQNS